MLYMDRGDSVTAFGGAASKGRSSAILTLVPGGSVEVTELSVSSLGGGEMLSPKAGLVVSSSHQCYKTGCKYP
jgi:hypothetical protein